MLRKLYMPAAIAAHLACAAEHWQAGRGWLPVVALLFIPWALPVFAISKTFVDLAMPLLIALAAAGVSDAPTTALAFACISLSLVAHHLFTCGFELQVEGTGSVRWPRAFILRELALLGAVIAGGGLLMLVARFWRPQMDLTWGTTLGFVALALILVRLTR